MAWLASPIKNETIQKSDLNIEPNVLTCSRFQIRIPDAFLSPNPDLSNPRFFSCFAQIQVSGFKIVVTRVLGFGKPGFHAIIHKI